MAGFASLFRGLPKPRFARGGLVEGHRRDDSVLIRLGETECEFECRGYICRDAMEGRDVRCPSCDCSLMGCGTISTERVKES